MELWIRVQKNKQLNQGLVKVEDLILEKDNANEWSIRQGCDTLAIYKTEKRALEVLDEIQKTLKPQLIIKDSGKIIGSFEDTIIREGATYELKELSTTVYQMPEE